MPSCDEMNRISGITLVENDLTSPKEAPPSTGECRLYLLER